MFNLLKLVSCSIFHDAGIELQKKLDEYPADQLIITDGYCETKDEHLNHLLDFLSQQAMGIVTAANALADCPTFPIIDLCNFDNSDSRIALIMMEMISHNLTADTQVPAAFQIGETIVVKCKIRSKKAPCKSPAEIAISDIDLLDFDPCYEEMLDAA